MEHTEEILEIVREIREDVSYMKRHRNMLCGMPVLEVDEVCDLLKMSDRQLRRYRTSGQLVGFRFGRRLLFSSAEITRFIERIEADCFCLFYCCFFLCAPHSRRLTSRRRRT